MPCRPQYSRRVSPLFLNLSTIPRISSLLRIPPFSVEFSLANKMREGLTVTTNRGATMIVRATRYPVTGRGGKGYGVLQRGSLSAIVPDEAKPVPPVEEVGE